MSGVEPVMPVRMSARSCREAFQRVARLEAALEAIRDYRPPVGDDVLDAYDAVRGLARAALEEQP